MAKPNKIEIQSIPSRHMDGAWSRVVVHIGWCFNGTRSSARGIPQIAQFQNVAVGVDGAVVGQPMGLVHVEPLSPTRSTEG